MSAKLKWNRVNIVKAIHIVFLCLLFGNVLMSSFQSDLIMYELDRKLIYFNIVASIYVILTALLRLHKKIVLSSFDTYLLLVAFYISLNYYLSIEWYNNIISSIILLVLICLSIKDLTLSYNCKDLVLFSLTSCFLAIGVFEGILGVLQIFQLAPSLGKNIAGTFFNTGIYAIYISITSSCALSLYVFCEADNFKKKLLKTLALVNIVLSIVVLPSTFSRSAWLASICSLVFTLLIRYRRSLQAVSIRIKLLLVLLIISMGLMLSAWGYKLKSSSADGRMVIWKTGLIALKENPVFGIRLGQIPYRFFNYQAEYFENEPKDAVKYTDRVDFAFNDMLQITIEHGIVGLILLAVGCIMLYKSIKSNWKADPLFLGAVSGILSVIISGFFSYPLKMISVNYAVLFFLCVVFLSGERPNKHFLTMKHATSLLAYGLIIAGCGYILLQQYKCIPSVSAIQKGQESLKDQNFKAAKTYFQTALENTPYQKNILPAYGLSQLNLNDYKGSIKSFSEAQKYLSDPFLSANMGTSYLRLSKYKQAEQQYLNAIRMAPNRMYFKYLLAKLYKETRDSSKLSNISREILTMPVKVESLAIQQMKSEIRNLINNEIK